MKQHLWNTVKPTVRTAEQYTVFLHYMLCECAVPQWTPIPWVRSEKTVWGSFQGGDRAAPAHPHSVPWSLGDQRHVSEGQMAGVRTHCTDAKNSLVPTETRVCILQLLWFGRSYSQLMGLPGRTPRSTSIFQETEALTWVILNSLSDSARTN